MRMDRAIKHAETRLYDRNEIEQIRKQLHQLVQQYRVDGAIDVATTRTKEKIRS